MKISVAGTGFASFICIKYLVGIGIKPIVFDLDNEISEENATLTHEATVGKIGEDQLFYLMSRVLSEDEATRMVVLGFFEPFTKELPMEYAVEMNRMMTISMEGSIG